MNPLLWASKMIRGNYSVPDALAKASTALNPIFPYQMTVTAGTLTSGDSVDDLAALDGNTVLIEEVAATPGFDVDFDFQGVGHADHLILYGRYEGNSAHIVEVQMWDYSSSAWRSLGVLDHTTVDSMKEYAVIDEQMTYKGSAQVRIVHTSAGVPGHDLYIDYMALK